MQAWGNRKGSRCTTPCFPQAWLPSDTQLASWLPSRVATAHTSKQARMHARVHVRMGDDSGAAGHTGHGADAERCAVPCRVARARCDVPPGGNGTALTDAPATTAQRNNSTTAAPKSTAGESLSGPLTFSRSLSRALSRCRARARSPAVLARPAAPLELLSPVPVAPRARVRVRAACARRRGCARTGAQP